MIARLSAHNTIAIDTESNSLHAFQEQVCLIQLSSDQDDFLVDSLALTELSALGELMANPAIQKVFHAGDYDIACLKRDYGFNFHNLFDTMLAATALNESNLGLASLLNKYLGISLDKKYQRANWGQRPLKEEMLAYAQGDSHYLPALRNALIPLLQKRGWLDLVLEACEAQGRATPPMKNHQENLYKVHGAHKLSPKALSLLQTLNHMRENLARKQDCPLFKILSDESLIEIAGAFPRFSQDLALLPSLSPGQARRYGKDILQHVEEWRKNPQSVYIQRPKRPSEAEMLRRQALSDWRKEQALRDDVPSNMVLPRELLDTLLNSRVTTLEELQSLMSFYPLRFERYGEPILSTLQRNSL